jgi:hypothetical protein
MCPKTIVLDTRISKYFPQADISVTVFLMGFWTPGRNRKLRVGIYVRVSTADQQTLPMQLDAIKKYLRARKWKCVLEVDDIGSGAKDRKKRQQLMVAAKDKKLTLSFF